MDVASVDDDVVGDERARRLELVDVVGVIMAAVNPKEDMELRKKALFWAGQSGVSIQELASLYDRMGDTEMKESIIFTLSQRQKDKASIDKLFDIAKNEKNSELRKKAIFWLGQSRDPRVQQFLVDLINK